MGKICLLSDQVASQVAAGEVVERPASLVKELVENSLDAGAKRIWVEYVGGGARAVTVRDDGCGMDREDALLCLERHATSKIRSGVDLAKVRTMGFRGEALPSIASVSRFRLVTREHGSDSGTEVLVAGGKVETVRETGAPPGTQIEVKDLFFNLPARRKFLRGEETESAHIVHGLQALALGNPKVAFECRRDGRSVLALPAAESLAVRIRDLLGAEHLAKLVEVTPVVGEGFQLDGFLAKPGQGRRDRLQQFVFLNGRPVHCAAVQQPLREAYAEALERGSQPLAVLNIEMDPELVDCNVHPAKLEVRLRQPDALRRAIYDLAREALTPRRVVAPVPRSLPSVAPKVFVPEAPQQVFPMEDRAPVLPEVTSNGAVVEEDRFRFLGSIEGGRLVLEGDEGLVLLDVRAATERILYESLMRGIESGEVPVQRLLMPSVIELPAREHAWVADHLEDLRAAGFLLESFGGASLKIEGLPALAGEREPQQLLHDIASTMRAAGKLPRGRGVREALARSVCHLAANGDSRVDAGRAQRLVRELLACELPYASPSGRPTMIQFSFAELDRKFGRS